MSETVGGTTVCYQHPGRPSNVRCQRCERYICGKCMREAAVGFHCPECVKEGAKTVRAVTSRYGGARSADPSLTTKALITINGLVFLLLMLTGGTQSGWLYKLALFSRDWRVRPGDESLPVYGVFDGAIWELLTAAFVHVRPTHLLLNMVALWFLGPQLEQAMGRARYLAVVVLSALAGNTLAVMSLSESSAGFGASGVVWGLLGSTLVLLVKEKKPLRQISLYIVFFGLLSFVNTNILWQGHLGGFIGGIAATAAVAYLPKGRSQWLGMVGVLAAIAVAFIAAYGAR